jgi:putative hydrolase of the HAD superfamily
MMVGNSLRSDVLPVLALGGSAIFVPYPATWEHEMADVPAQDQPGFYQLDAFRDLPALLARLDGNR